MAGIDPDFSNVLRTRIALAATQPDVSSPTYKLEPQLRRVRIRGDGDLSLKSVDLGSLTRFSSQQSSIPNREYAASRGSVELEALLADLDVDLNLLGATGKFAAAAEVRAAVGVLFVELNQRFSALGPNAPIIYAEAKTIGKDVGQHALRIYEMLRGGASQGYLVSEINSAIVVAKNTGDRFILLIRSLTDMRGDPARSAAAATIEKVKIVQNKIVEYLQLLQAESHSAP